MNAPLPAPKLAETTPKPRLLCVGTHHKTGTVWMRRTLHRAKAAGILQLMHIGREKRIAEIPPNGPVALVNWASAFPKSLFSHPEARFLHVIRDPRDVLISGMRYHLTAPLGNEKALREKRREWGGMTYQAYLNAIPTTHRRLMFEMEHIHHQTIEQMVAWDRAHPQAREVRYEDLITDTDCTLFRSTLEDLGIDGLDVDALVQAYWDEALFGGAAAPEERKGQHAAHIKSGKPSQWRTKMPRRIAEEYARRYSGHLKTLGYAENNDWVDETPFEGDLS